MQKTKQLNTLVFKRKSSKFIWIIFRMMILIGLSFVILNPILRLFSLSLRLSSQLFDSSVVWIPRQLTFENIKNAVIALKFTNTLSYTAKLIIPSVIFQIISCSIVGYGFARFELPFKKVLMTILVFLIIVPPQIVGIPTFLYYKDFDFFGVTKIIGAITGQNLSISILDSIWCFYLPAIFSCGIKSFLFIYMFMQFFRGLPKDLEEAAYLDGCGLFRTYTSIISPIAIPVYIIVFLFSTVWYYNDTFFSGLFLSNNNTLSMALMNVPATIANLSVQKIINLIDPYKGVLALQAASLIYVLPLMILFLPLQKYFVESIETTGIVG